jgi:DNA-binding NtrC family response regulator
VGEFQLVIASPMPERAPILICDDDDMIVQIVTSKLRSEGREVVTASNGASALQMIKASLPSALILDAVICLAQSMGKRLMYYMMDCFAPHGGMTESVRIVESSESGAIEEAVRAAQHKHPDYFQMREVSSSGDRVFFDSRKTDAHRP